MDMNEQLLICNAAHKCKIKPCIHRQPHIGLPAGNKNDCGPSSECYESKIISKCVPVADSKYTTSERIWCEHCEGRGFHDVKTEHIVPAEDAR